MTLLLHRPTGRVWSDGTDAGNPGGVMSWHPGTGEVRRFADDPQLAAFADGRLYGVSDDGSLVAVGRPVVHRGSKVDLAVVRLSDGAELLRTKRHLVYDVVFGAGGDVLLVEAFRSKPRRYVFDAASGGFDDRGELAIDYRTFTGERDPLANRFLSSAERAAGRVISTDLVNGEVDEMTVPIPGVVRSIQFLGGGERLLVQSEEGVHCLTERWEPVWDAPVVGKVHVVPDGSLVCVEQFSTAHNPWGVEIVLDAATGARVSQIESFEGRGRLACGLTGTAMLLHGGRSLDLASGEVSDAIVVPGFVEPSEEDWAWD